MTEDWPQSKALQLMIEYRPTIWRKSALEAVPGVGHKALQSCMERINFTQKIVNALRSNELLGEKLYWIIHASYLTDRQLGDIDEILDHIAHNHEHIPRSTYFRLRTRAINMMDDRLNEMVGLKIAS